MVAIEEQLKNIRNYYEAKNIWHFNEKIDMKILQVIPYFTPRKGGDVNVCYNLSKQLVKRGHVVTIITTDFEFDEEYSKSIEKEGARVIPFQCVINIHLFLYSPSMEKWLRDNITNFDIVHLHDFRSYQNNVVHNYAKKYQIPYVLQAHGSVLPFFQKQRLKKIFDLLFGYRILKDALKVIALTKTEAEQYKKMGVGENKIEIVPNGINLSEYKNLPDRGVFRRKYGIKSNEKIVLYLGRIHRIKRVDLLVEAFSNLVSKMDGVTLVIAGPDDGFLSTLKAQIEDLKISERIIFVGPLYEKDKLEAYVDADVYVLPSVYETFPVTVLEACACGTAVIVTDRCGISDIVEEVGVVVEYDKSQLKDAIFKILSDEELRKRFEDQGKKLVEEEYNWDKIVNRVENIYKSCKFSAKTIR